MSAGSAPEPRAEGRLRVGAALVALSERAGGDTLVRALLDHGAAVYATTGTAAYLRGLGLEVRAAELLTRTPEFLGGRVKTLSPDLFGAILARRGDADDERDLAARGLAPLDLVAVTLYPFESVPAAAAWDEVVEQIDVGGVSLLRAAAKNFAHVAVLSTPAQYPEAGAALAAGGTTLAERRGWAQAAFERTAEYDALISGFFAARGGGGLPAAWVRAYRRTRDLRYGENPHQEAALYTAAGRTAWWSEDPVLEGKELSFNNLVDLEAAARIAYDFAEPACAVVKHNEPSGVGLGATVAEAYRRAVAADELSAFGGVVAVNREVDEECAAAMGGIFLECVAAPSFGAAARAELGKRKNLRAVVIPPAALAGDGWEMRARGHGLLVQRERPDAAAAETRVVTRRAPTAAELDALRFAWRVAARARSNAVVVARADRTLGVGSGQTSRIDALHVALMKARRAGHDVRGAGLASDGFFPFADWVEVARDAGLTACIQPGGSVRDAESIAAADAAGLAMVFTGRRQFRH